MTELKVTGKHESGWVTISTDEYESMKATIEVLSDPVLMEQLRKSDEDIKAGRTKKWDEILKELKQK